MKNPGFVALILSAGLVLPALARQTNSNSTAQTAASADQVATERVTATGKQPLQPPSHDFWDGDDPGVAWLVLHPFASKGYVRRHLQPIQDRVKELDELTATNGKGAGDVDNRVRQGIQLTSARADMADQHAQDAAKRAETANQTATALNARLASVQTKVGAVDDFKSTTQIELRCRPSQGSLSQQAKHALDELATQVKDEHGYIIEVQGFSSGRGQVAIANSRKIADSVRRYLVFNHEIPAYRIYTIAMGNASDRHGTSLTRVEISLLKKDVAEATK